MKKAIYTEKNPVRTQRTFLYLLCLFLHVSCVQKSVSPSHQTLNKIVCDTPNAEVRNNGGKIEVK